MGPTRKLPEKKEVLESFLKKGSAQLFIDARREGVVVPDKHAKKCELVLLVGETLGPDLKVSDEGVSCTLAFNRVPFWCSLPWAAVYAMASSSDGRGVVWPDDIPVESQILKVPDRRPKLSVVKRQVPAQLAIPLDVLGDDRPADGRSQEELSSRPGKKRAKKAPVADVLPSLSKTDVGQPKRPLPPYLRVVK